MKNFASFSSVILISIVLIITRIFYTDTSQSLPIKVTTWDALGYYLYLPSTHIYHDDSSFDWFKKIDSTYQLSGGTFYQAQPHANGKLVYKYLRGVSLLQLPFYYAAHAYAIISKQYPADGFSYPYQFAIAFGALFFVILSLFILRNILIRYYKDSIVAITLFLLVIASNAIQYIAIEGGQSHGYIFPLYVFILYCTIRWHENYKLIWSFLIGLIIGIATISRPTEAIMLLIPLLWNKNNVQLWNEKWQKIKQQKTHLIVVFIGGFLGILPQLIYWKRITGSWIYDVGSKWDFLNPHFRVLVGWEKGWFIYTPVTMLFVIGLFFLKQKPFKTAIITFCILNIYIIISWHIWRYGGSYSTRALVQSYPVFAIPLAGIVDYIMSKKLKWVFIPLSIYLIIFNLFQLRQYNLGILHYDDMNRKFYSSIYLNPNPSALDMSLLDTKDFISNESGYNKKTIYEQQEKITLIPNITFFEDTIKLNPSNHQQYLKVNARINSNEHLWNNSLMATCILDNDTLTHSFRLMHPLAKVNQVNDYAFYIQLPSTSTKAILSLKINSTDYHGELESLKVCLLCR
jgi:hypothetical protein